MILTFGDTILASNFQQVKGSLSLLESKGSTFFVGGGGDPRFYKYRRDVVCCLSPNFIVLIKLSKLVCGPSNRGKGV